VNPVSTGDPQRQQHGNASQLDEKLECQTNTAELMAKDGLHAANTWYPYMIYPSYTPAPILYRRFDDLNL
jgi:hypothetical protein